MNVLATSIVSESQWLAHIFFFGQSCELQCTLSNFIILEKLLKMLDDPRNDIYLHIDKKTSNVDYDRLNCAVSESTLYYVSRMKVTWGAYSMIQCELRLLEAAYQGGYEYYHMISGTDIPIKSQDYIHEFMERHKGKEFVHFAGEEYSKMIRSRFSVYHFLHEFCGKNRKNPLFHLEKFLVFIQKIIKVDRTRKSNLTFCGGTTWYSITNELVCYVLSQRELIKKLFSYGYICDEVFLQTVVCNSPFLNDVFMLNSMKDDCQACLRLNDWKRGCPYEFKTDDAQELISAGPNYLFARKVTDTQSALVEAISSSFGNKGFKLHSP